MSRRKLKKKSKEIEQDLLSERVLVQCSVDSNQTNHFISSSALTTDDCEEEVKALGNFICRSPDLVNDIIAKDFVRSLVSSIGLDSPTFLLRHVNCMIVELMGLPLPAETLIETLEPLSVLLYHPDINILIDTLRTIDCLSSRYKHQFKLANKSRLVQKLISLFDLRDIEVQKKALCLVIPIIENRDTQKIDVDSSIVACLPKLLLHSDERIGLLAFSLLPNIRMDSQAKVSLIKSLLTKLFENLNKGAIPQQGLTALLVCQFSFDCNRDLIPALVKEGIIPPFCNLLNCNNEEVIRDTCRFLHYMLEEAESSARNIAELINECGGLRKIQNLQTNEVEHIPKSANHMIQEYFSGQVNAFN